MIEETEQRLIKLSNLSHLTELQLQKYFFPFRFYKWKSSFFSKESTASLDLPNKSSLFVYNENNAEPLILSVGFGNTTRVTILKLNLETNQWTKLQSMHFTQSYIKHYVMHGQLYLIGCPTDAFCAIYRWTNDQFRRHVKLSSQVLKKVKDIYFRHDMVIVESFQAQLSFYSSDDVLNARPGLMRTNPPSVVDFAVYKSPISQLLYFVEFIFKRTSLAINFYDISIDKIRDRDGRSELKLKDPIECITKLKALLKTRITKVQASQLMVRSNRKAEI